MRPSQRARREGYVRTYVNEVGFAAASQEARNWHDFQCDQLQCGNFSVREGSAEGGSFVLQKMREAGMTANVISFGAAI